MTARPATRCEASELLSADCPGGSTGSSRPLRSAARETRSAAGAGPSCGLPGQSATALNRCGPDGIRAAHFYYFFATSINTSTQDLAAQFVQRRHESSLPHDP